ncbi:MAG: DUF4906 domain-containing protein [Bacteroidales bacterium]|jgi:hypothetical protein|nr:DUF4906 domain-containing protein [Bacteroidales bacterium]MCI1733487.1 DUF4906 domain-containing protein [Bacteroidales bacterium]
MKNSFFNISIAILLAVTIAIVLVVSAITGCTKDTVPGALKENEGKANINISFFLPQKAWTKLLTVSPIQVSNVNIYVCAESGIVVKCQYLSGTFSMNVPIQKGEKYYLYAIANAGKQIILKDTAAIENYSWGVSAASALADASGGVVMSGKTGLIALSDGASVPITLTRCVAKITLRGDKSSLNNGVQITINSAAIKNIPKSVRLFKINKVADAVSVMDGDIISGSDLNNFFTSGVTFYMFENMQGTLMPANTDQTKKVWPDNNLYSKICSYIELNASYMSLLKKGTLLYRFYLGKDMVGNFDVERNSQHTITVFFAGDGSLNENTWRVDIESITDLVTDVVLPSRIGIAGLGNVRHVGSLIVPPTAADKTLLWKSSDVSIATVDQSGNVTSAGFGYCSISATSCDGGNITGVCIVTVGAGEVSFPAGPRTMFDGESAEIKWAKISPADSEPEVKCSDASVVKVNYVNSSVLNVTALKPGSATLTATLGSSSSSYVINVEALKVNFTKTAPVSIFEGFDSPIEYTITPSHASSLKLKWEYVSKANDESYFSFINGNSSNVVRGLKASNLSYPAHSIKVSFVDYPSKVFTTSVKVMPAITINDGDINLLANAFVTAATGKTYSNISREHYLSYTAHPGASISWTTSQSDYLRINSSGKVYTDESTTANGVYVIYAETRGNDGVLYRKTVNCTVWEEINVLGITEYTQDGEEDGYPYFTIQGYTGVKSLREGGYAKTLGDGFTYSSHFDEFTRTHVEGAVGDPSYLVEYTVLEFNNPFDSVNYVNGYKYRYYVSDSSWIH